MEQAIDQATGVARRTIDVVIGILVRDGRVLICQRPPDTTFPNHWEFPGGKREAGETVGQCLARELREELAVAVRPLTLLDPIEHDYPTARVRLHPHVCALADGGEPRPLACQQMRWVDPPALRQYRFPPANEPLIERVIETVDRLNVGMDDVRKVAEPVLRHRHYTNCNAGAEGVGPGQVVDKLIDVVPKTTASPASPASPTA